MRPRVRPRWVRFSEWEGPSPEPGHVLRDEQTGRHGRVVRVRRFGSGYEIKVVPTLLHDVALLRSTTSDA